jgi:hypothetical protein
VIADAFLPTTSGAYGSNHVGVHSSGVVLNAATSQTGYIMSAGSAAMTFGPTGASIYLGGLTTANKLDDYEEGTWTPSLRNGTTAMTVTWHYGPTAVYTKIGRQVTIHLAGKLSALSGTGTGELRVFGLPFQPAGTGGYQEYRVNMNAGNNVIAADSSKLFGFIRNGGNDVGTRILNGGDTVFTSNQIDADTFFSIYGTYFTDQ